MDGNGRGDFSGEVVAFTVLSLTLRESGGMMKLLGSVGKARARV